MRNTIQTIIILLLIVSCTSKNTQKQEPQFFKFVDTAIIFKNNKQNVKLWFDSVGNIELISLLTDTNAEHIFLTQSGKINQIQMTRENDIQLMYDFYSDGQIKKVKWMDLSYPFVNNQDIEFIKSQSKSLMIDENSSHTPIIMGHLDTFKINKWHEISFKDIFIGGPTKYTIDTLLFQSSDLNTNLSIDRTAMIVKTSKSGTYRLVAKIRTTFLTKPKQKNWTEEGSYFKIDLNLIFK